MRIKQLVIMGFGPYKDEQRIDFEDFRSDGLFLITGKTGAGKSSILDAICYALYGSIPRFDNTQQKLRSDHCAANDPTFVELDFAVHDIDYRVRRSPEYERTKKSGTGTTMSKPAAQLSVLIDGEWQAAAVGPKDVALDLDRIIGLTKEQFLQVILLAQNRFQEFLLAKNDDRQAVLRSLFGTRRFEQIEMALVERRKVLEAELGSARNTLMVQATRMGDLLEDTSGASGASEMSGVLEVPLDPDALTVGWFDASLNILEERRAAAAAVASGSDVDFTAADASHRTLIDIQRSQTRRDNARERLGTLSSADRAIDADRLAFEAANRAAVVWPHVTAKQEAQAVLNAATADELSARESYHECESDGENSAIANETLKARIDEVTRALGTLESVLEEERVLPDLDADIEILQERFDGCRDAAAEATGRIDALPQQIDVVMADLGTAQVRASGEGAANDSVIRLVSARAAAALAHDLEQQHKVALSAETATSGESATAATQLHTLMQQRLKGHAAELASELKDAHPCAVCGSKNHPEPAIWDAEPVTENDIERARAITDERKADLDAAHSAAQELSIRLAEVRIASENKSVEQLDDDLQAAHLVLSGARQALEDVAAHETQLQRLRTELAAAKSSLADLVTAKDECSRELSAQQSRRDSIHERVTRQRGDYESVFERVGQLQTHLESANRLAEATDRTKVQEMTLAAAVATLAAQLAEADFAGEEQVIVARRTTAEINEYDERVREHDRAVGSVKAVLAEPELAGLPTAPVDLKPVADALERAREWRDRSFAARSSLEQRCVQANRIVASARVHHTTSAAVQDQFAQLRELASVVQGKEPNTKRMRLETYVLAAQLEEIVASANTRLRTMSGGRYALEHDDSVQFRNAQSGLGLTILDEHTGRGRSPHSLSGGEMFLASLALALGLAEVVTNQTGGITLDTLFIDEGFGSLDNDTLEVAMSTLDGLRAGGRTIGLISHVDAMKEQIAAKLHISITDHGHSTIEKTMS